ncbi:unnamed protein product [Brassica oleracea var. botrytis]
MPTYLHSYITYISKMVRLTIMDNASALFRLTFQDSHEIQSRNHYKHQSQSVKADTHLNTCYPLLL